MLDKIKELLSNWKVSVALVGGAIVVMTTFGTCTFEPGASSETEDQEEVEVEGSQDAATETNTEATTTEAVETTETTGATTEEENSENSTESE